METESDLRTIEDSEYELYVKRKIDIGRKQLRQEYLKRLKYMK